MGRLTLVDVGHELDVFRDMGVHFTLDKDGMVVFECAPRAIACAPAAGTFRAEHIVELRAYLHTQDERARKRLEFYRWLAEDKQRWGKFPGMRVLRGVPGKKVKS